MVKVLKFTLNKPVDPTKSEEEVKEGINNLRDLLISGFTKWGKELNGKAAEKSKKARKQGKGRKTK